MFSTQIGLSDKDIDTLSGGHTLVCPTDQLSTSLVRLMFIFVIDKVLKVLNTHLTFVHRCACLMFCAKFVRLLPLERMLTKLPE